jgi:hypothetical protein
MKRDVNAILSSIDDPLILQQCSSQKQITDIPFIIYYSNEIECALKEELLNKDSAFVSSFLNKIGRFSLKQTYEFKDSKEEFYYYRLGILKNHFLILYDSNEKVQHMERSSGFPL